MAHLPHLLCKRSGVAAVRSAAKPTQSEETVTGRVSALLIFARFQDEDDGSDSVPEYAAGIFDPDLPGSLTHFYNEMSRGQFVLDGTALPRWYTSSQPASAYVADEDGERGGYGRFVRDILKAVDEGTDFSQFDNDGPDGVPNSGDDDGHVDFLFMVLRSTPERFIVTRATGISGLGLESDFITEDTDVEGRRTAVRTDGDGGALQRGRTAAEAIGSMAHEYGHALDLPDLFDTDFTTARWGTRSREGLSRHRLLGTHGARRPRLAGPRWAKSVQRLESRAARVDWRRQRGSRAC